MSLPRQDMYRDCFSASIRGENQMERTRTSVLPQVDENTAMTRMNYPGPTQTDYSDTVRTSSGYHTMTDVEVDNFHARSKKGEVFFNPMTKYYESEERAPMDIDITFNAGINKSPPTTSYSVYSGTVGQGWDIYFPFLEIPSGVLDELDDRRNIALTSAFAGSTVAKASALVTIGEGKETVTGVIDVFQRLLRIIKAVKNKQFKALRKELKPSELADFWMEVRYGIRPIIFDMLQIIDALKDTTEVGSRLTSRGFQSFSYNESDVHVNLLGNYDLPVNRSLELTYSCRAGVLSKVDRAGVLELFGVNRPLSAIYDLATLSFVIDWFFNVGDLIAAHEPDAALTTLGAWTVETTDLIRTMKVAQITNCTKNPDVTTSGSLSMDVPWVKSSSTVIRTPQTRASYLPRFKLNLNWAKCIDLSIIGRNIMKAIRSDGMRINRHGRLVLK